MNKKFSTLVAALLLSGALFTVEAKELTPSDVKVGIEVSTNLIKFTEDVDLKNDYLVITDAGTVIDGNQHILKGRIVIKADGCVIKNFKNIYLKNEAGNASEEKNAITVAANSVTIIDNTITCEGVGTNMANGISVFPLSADAKFEIKDNTIKNANSVSGDWQSCAIIVAEGVSNKASLFDGTSATLNDFDIASISDNTFEKCAADYNYVAFSNNNADAENKALKVVPLAGENGLANTAFIKSLVEDAAKNSVNIFDGTVEELQAALEDEAISGNSAVQCLGDADGNGKGNVLFGNAENPDNGMDAVVADVAQFVDEDGKTITDLYGYEFLAKADNNYNMLIINAADDDKYYAVTVGGKRGFLLVEVTEDDISSLSKSETSLWKTTTGSDPAGGLYYSFESQAKDANDKPITFVMGGNKGAFYPANVGATYNNGVVFNVGKKQLYYGEKNSEALEEGKYCFGLFKAAENALSVADLNYFEQDGFSVTIKYQDEDGKFTKEDIAGNEFVGHLTPMRWDDTNEEFVEFTDVTDNETEFYLKNADGEYIVVNAKDAGASGNNVLYFSTLSEQALEHHLVADEPQEYFGEFRALVSASNQTDYTKLTAIDELQINVNGWLTIGRWDKDEKPTLAAATSTITLQPIQIALGSDKIVKAKDLLKKGKFYTVEIVASTKEDDKNVGLKMVAGAQDDDEPTSWDADWWVKSYGNVLEGQFALTIEKGNEGVDYYVFTNRENKHSMWFSPVNALYTTDEDNEYRYGIYTYKIDTVAGHKASDGYMTLPDVRNNKFHIAASSGVYDNNAWFVENHEGDENHVIGLNPNQEDALIYTAKEYAAARQLKVEDKETHKYYYAPSDSIYVISELGYFDGDDYETTLDTLKLVSYSFVNQYTEPLIYNKDGEGRYESEVYKTVLEDGKLVERRYKNVEEAQKAAQHFALRIDGTKLNLRPVDATIRGTEYNDALNENWVGAWSESTYKAFGKDADKFLYQGLNGDDKVYSGVAGDEGMLSNVWYLDREENDLFVVEPTEKPMYRTVINPLDTISIFRDDNSQSVLFEHNTFLGMENLSQYPEIAKAMIADTAYVRNNTYRPQYMLVVGADITPAGKWCPIHGDDPTCPDAHKVETSGWVEGRYLVNLVDTAIAWDAANKHKDNNPYINSEKYYRLGFVQAKHINDSLVIASTNDTLYVGSEDYNQAKFAFRYVDQEAGSFVIETANYNRLPGVEEAEINEDAPLGYLKWMNGVVVVVDDINNADVYNMNENETDTPTANEDIAVEEGVQVIAGNGAVTIQGAAGKTVVITNILGKAVANTTLTSDNQTINVPAGIVVVTVDGEAVKAIVK